MGFPGDYHMKISKGVTKTRPVDEKLFGSKKRKEKKEKKGDTLKAL